MKSGSPLPRAPNLALSARFELALDLALRVAAADVGPLVPDVLAAGECDLDLDAAFLEVHARRHEREAALPHLAVELVDLARVQEQLAVPVRVVRAHGGLVVRRDLRADEPDL